MGNCIDHQRSATWVDDDEDWEPADLGSHRGDEAGDVAEDKKDLLGAKGGIPSTVVKIKITKKQLEELLQKADVSGLPIQQVLAGLMSLGNTSDQDHGHQWRPTLQSIPEVSESTIDGGSNVDIRS